MIKIQLNYREIECLYQYLKGCITHGQTTADKEKEYLVACYIQSIMKRLYKKMADTFHEGCNSTKEHELKINAPEVLSIYKYFNRYELPIFLNPTREKVFNSFKSNTTLLEIINENKKYEETTSSISEY